MQMEWRLDLGRLCFCRESPLLGQKREAGGQETWAALEGVGFPQGEAVGWAPGGGSPHGGSERGLDLSEARSLEVPSQNREGKRMFCAPQGVRGHLGTQGKDQDGELLRFCVHRFSWNTGTCMQVGVQELTFVSPFL